MFPVIDFGILMKKDTLKEEVVALKHRWSAVCILVSFFFFFLLKYTAKGHADLSI